MPLAIATSVAIGRCGPCCSVEAIGRMAIVVSGERSAKSVVVNSFQKNDLTIAVPRSCPYPFDKAKSWGSKSTIFRSR